MAVGLHQGLALSPYIFQHKLDALTVKIQEEAPWYMLFADDIILVDVDELRSLEAKAGELAPETGECWLKNQQNKN